MRCWFTCYYRGTQCEAGPDVTGEARNVMLVQVIQITQPKRCNSFTSLLLDVYAWLNMFRASPRPSPGAYNCTRSLWFYRWREVAPAASLQR
jgi:hypothetical protein